MHRENGTVVALDFISPGSGPIWLDDVECQGTESSLDDCDHAGWGNSDCTHEEDVAVTCQPDPLPGIQITDRYTPGSSLLIGLHCRHLS